MREIYLSPAKIARILEFCASESLGFDLFRSFAMRADFTFDDPNRLKSALREKSVEMGKAKDLSGKKWYEAISTIRYNNPKSYRQAMTLLVKKKIGTSPEIVDEACKACEIAYLPETYTDKFLEEIWNEGD